MKVPIGIICSENSEDDFFFLRQDYIRSLEQAGALPILLPITENPSQLDRYLSLCQGIVLSGGGDIAPEFLPIHPEEESLFNNIDVSRDLCEFYVVKQAIKKEIPLFGICRGCQVLNVALNGTLIPHLNPDAGHMQQENRSVATHPIIFQEDCLLRTLTTEASPKVNSFHHQAILQPGKNLHVVAHSPDGIIEAIEHKKLPFCIGVQWHPESLFDAFSQALFSAFVQTAAQMAIEKKAHFFHRKNKK